MFHYLLYAHARGTPRSQPCLSFGEPGPYDANNGTSCITANPNFNPLKYHVPTTAGGIAEMSGGNAMVTLGLWDEFVGRPFVRASTTFHELGHNLNLWHGGLPAIWGDNKPLTPSQATSTYIEPNCKPNYPSSMSYLFQVHGLFDDNDDIHLDYSGSVIGALNETATLTDGSLVPLPAYRSAWFAPSSSPLALQLGVSEATRYCSGPAFAPNPNPHMARVYGSTVGAAIDWNGDLTLNSVPSQDVNLDSTASTALFGFDDWSNIRLNQIAAGRKVVKFQAELADGTGYGDTTEYGSSDTTDSGSADTQDYGGGDTFPSVDIIDFGSGVFYDQLSATLIDLGSADTVDSGSADTTDFGQADTVDSGSADTVDSGSGSPRQEVDYDLAKGLGRVAPYGLKGCVIGNEPGCNITPPAGPNTPLYHRNRLLWHASTVGHVAVYLVQRKLATASDATYTQIGTSTSNHFEDPEELPNGVSFTYRVRAQFDDPASLSGWSQPVTTTAVNDAPVAAAESYTTLNNTTLTVLAATGVLANDASSDGPAGYIGRVAVLVTTTTNGTLVLNPDGGFVYNPKGSFVGNDSFTYISNDGPWPTDPTIPLSADSVTVTVSIQVKKKNVGP